MTDSTVYHSKIFKEDLALATGGTGAAETGTRLTSAGGVLTLTKIDAEHLMMRDSGLSVETEINLIQTNQLYTCTTRAEIDAALTTIGSDSATIYLIPATFAVSTDLTFPANVDLKVAQGAVFAVATTKTLTINGTLGAGLYQIFSCTGTGTVVLGAQSVGKVHPEWWYSGTGSWDTSLDAAVACRTAATQNVVEITGDISCITGLATITADNVTIQGPGGQNSASITFTPTGAATLFKWESAGATNMAELKDLELIGSGVQTKTFINPVDVTHFKLSNVRVTDATGVSSIALYTQGTDNFRVETFTAYCDRPIVIGGDLDGAVFRNLNLTTLVTAGKNIEILTGANLSNVYFEPTFHCNLGAHGIYWADTTTTVIAINISIRGLRHEQNTADGWGVYISHNTGIGGLTIDGCWSGAQNGFYFRKVSGSMRNCTNVNTLAGSGGGAAYNAGVALDFDTPAGDFVMENFGNTTAQGGADATGIVIGASTARAFRTSRVYGAYSYATSTLEVFTPTTDLNGAAARTVHAHNGVQYWRYEGTLGAGASVTLPINSTTCRSGRLWVSAYCVGDTVELLDCLLSTGAVPVMLDNSTTNTDDADTANNICLITGANMTVKNNRAGSADITIHAEWAVTVFE